MVRESINLYAAVNALAPSNGKGERKSWAGYRFQGSDGSGVMGQTASLLAKTVPSLPHNSFMRELKPAYDYFP